LTSDAFIPAIDLWNCTRMEVPPGDGNLAHAVVDLHAVVPLLSAFEAAVDLHDDVVVEKLDPGDLHGISGARRGTAFLGDCRPLLPVVGAGLGVELQRLPGARHQHLGIGIFSREAARQFHAVFECQLVLVGRLRHRRQGAGHRNQG
jgi:hypothetical protein